MDNISTRMKTLEEIEKKITTAIQSAGVVGLLWICFLPCTEIPLLTTVYKYHDFSNRHTKCGTAQCAQMAEK